MHQTFSFTRFTFHAIPKHSLVWPLLSMLSVKCEEIDDYWLKAEVPAAGPFRLLRFIEVCIFIEQ